jgi:hypothetical protein
VADPAPLEIQVSRSAKRFIDRRLGGSVYVWRYAGDAADWIDGAEALETGAQPQGEVGVTFWRHEVNDQVVFVGEDVKAPVESDVLYLDYRRRPEKRIVATWIPDQRPAGALGELINSLAWILWPFR